ncbi:hypothetical protein BV20DRAFT_951560 [Pilatotrama ljubarskyi]|nr:hypothetical protein BV20DRAFT_951560 [Pilatotrama ljubarskyi]
MVAQLSVPGQSSPATPDRSRAFLHPYTYSHSNTSRTSRISIGVQSTSTSGQPHHAHVEAAHHRPEARPTARAAARGISRVASRAPSHAPSRATSRSRSRAPSPSTARSHVHLPHTAVLTPTASQNTLAIPNVDTASLSPESFPSIALPREDIPREDKIWPILSIPRYDDNPTITPNRADWLLQPVTLNFPIEGVPEDWTSCVHPEGRLYFYHPDKRMYTDADVRDRKLRAILQAFEETLLDIIHDQNIVLPPDYEVVLYLEERTVSGGYNWLYYYVDPNTRSLFWLEEFDIIDELNEVTGIKTLSDIKYGIEAKYWLHCEMYPYRHQMSEETFAELSGMLTFASIDIITSMTSTVTYTADEVHRMLGLVKSAKAVGKTDYATVVVARLMNLFVHQRFLNLYGQTYARLGRDQSIYNTTKHHRTPLITLLSPLFWNAPGVHLRGLEKIWIDGLITIQPWSTFIGKLQNEWQEFVLYATVLLNANVAFLAIPSVDNDDEQLTAAQITSYLSIVTSVGSIVLGLLLIRQHRVKSKDTAHEAWRYLNSRKHPTLGLETLAIIYSLPYALLMWGMVTFLLAFSFECFSTPDRLGVILTAAVWVAVAILVCWCVYTGWEGGETSGWDRPRAWWSRLFPEKEKCEGIEGEESSSLRGLSEKAPVGRLLRLVKDRLKVFPHSSDPPTTEMQQRDLSSV